MVYNLKKQFEWSFTGTLWLSFTG